VNIMRPEELLQMGKLPEALAELEGLVRAAPADVKLRVFLFQLLSVMGEWERAMTQINVVADMDAGALLMARLCGPALNAEALRADVLAGRRTPLVFGEPAEWVGKLVEANRLLAEGHGPAAQTLRAAAFEAAPSVPGAIDDHPFEWIADADPRLGPVLEVVLNGNYCWVPMIRVREVRIEAPVDLRDLVWIPATFIWTNGGEAAGLIPSRYPGSEKSSNSAVRMARKTEWTEVGPDCFQGLGQRMFATDTAEYPLLETRRIVFETK